MVRGPYRPQPRKYEAILQGIQQIARADARIGRSTFSRYTRFDYRLAYATAFLSSIRAANAEATHD